MKTAGRGRLVDEWKARPSQPHNCWRDCLVGIAVAPSMLGAALPNFEEPPKKRMTLSDIQRLAREGRGRPYA